MNGPTGNNFNQNGPHNSNRNGPPNGYELNARPGLNNIHPQNNKHFRGPDNFNNNNMLNNTGGPLKPYDHLNKNDNNQDRNQGNSRLSPDNYKGMRVTDVAQKKAKPEQVLEEFIVEKAHEPFNQQKKPAPGNHSRYKTELCTNWMLTRNCTYGNKCNFAHGIHDLKARKRLENYKSQPCCDPARAGCKRCLYGSRCNYAHPGEAIRRSMNRGYFDQEYYGGLQKDFDDNTYPFGIYV